jgi:hypothetical protein
MAGSGKIAKSLVNAIIMLSLWTGIGCSSNSKNEIETIVATESETDKSTNTASSSTEDPDSTSDSSKSTSETSSDTASIPTHPPLDLSGESASKESFSSIITFSRNTNISEISTQIVAEKCDVAASTAASSETGLIETPIQDSNWPPGNSIDFFIYELVALAIPLTNGSNCSLRTYFPIQANGLISSKEKISTSSSFTINVSLKLDNIQTNNDDDRISVGITLPFQDGQITYTFVHLSGSNSNIITQQGTAEFSNSFLLTLSEFFNFRMVFDGSNIAIYINEIQRLLSVPVISPLTFKGNAMLINFEVASSGGRATYTLNDVAFIESVQLQP